jgi:hypothetical protein
MLWFYAEIFSVQAEVLTLLAGNRWKLFHPELRSTNSEALHGSNRFFNVPIVTT